MEARELRIGNIVSYFSDAIDTWLDNHELSANDILCIDGGADHAEGIAITEEWLLNLGFVRDYEENQIIKYRTPDVDICGNSTEGFALMNGEEQTAWSKRYQYVHEIQNLYFALTGEDLEIKPV